MTFQNVMVAGSGVLGSQIAFQTAYKEFNVSVYDIHDDAIANAKERMMKLKERYKQDLGASDEALESTYNRISFYTDLAEAVQDADLVIEAVPELVDIKTEFYQQLAQVAPEKTIFATNSSTFVPSHFFGGNW